MSFYYLCELKEDYSMMQTQTLMRKHKLPEKYSAKTVARALAITTIEQRAELQKYSGLLKQYDSIMHRLFTDSFGGEPQMKQILMTTITGIINTEAKRDKKLGLHTAFVNRCFTEMDRLAKENNEEVTMGFIEEHPDDEIIPLLLSYGALKHSQVDDGKVYYNVSSLPTSIKVDILYPLINPILTVCKKYGIMIFVGEDFDLYLPKHAKLVDEVNEVLGKYKGTEDVIQVNPLLNLRFAGLT